MNTRGDVKLHPESKLTLIRRLDRRGTKWFGLYRCACGAEKEIRMTATGAGGGTLSCGCFGRVQQKKSAVTHGMSTSREWRSWAAIFQRCLNQKSAGYARYGARGITICARWQESFENFYADMGPSNGLTIDRINNDGNYEPGNCRWATVKEQAANKTYPLKERTHCKHGHLYDDANTRWRHGKRECRACGKEYQQMLRDRGRA